MAEAVKKLDKTALCRELWRERPDATAKEIAELFEARHGESCAAITAQKAKKKGNGKKDDGGELTASELLAVKEIAKRHGGLDKLAAIVDAAEEAAGAVGGLGRLRAGVEALRKLTTG